MSEGLVKITLTEAEAAQYIGMCRGYLRQDRMYGKSRPGRTSGPQYLRIGRAIRYLKVDLDAWLNAHKVIAA
jgi:hypothetical protein